MRDLVFRMGAPKPRIGIAGQLPPPWGGQNLAIAALWKELQIRPEVEAVFVPFCFTPTAGRVRRPTLGKVWELFRVRERLAKVAWPQPLDVLLLPVGGPQTVPLIRDLFLLPWGRRAARCLALQFHAAGFADRLRQKPSALVKRVARLLGEADVAFIMANANRADPEVCGIRDIRIRPHRIPDANPQGTTGPKTCPELLYVGHLGNEKGTPQLIQAMAHLPGELRLTLVGEPLPPWTFHKLEKLAKDAGVLSRVRFVGSRPPNEIGAYYRGASLFVFPSVAPYESFGLVLAEAMMWGLPVVASDWRANREVLGPGANWLYNPADPQALLHAMEEAWGQRVRWDALGRANRQHYEAHYRHGEGVTVADDLASLGRRFSGHRLQ